MAAIYHTPVARPLFDIWAHSTRTQDFLAAYYWWIPLADICKVVTLLAEDSFMKHYIFKLQLRKDPELRKAILQSLFQ